MRASAPECVPAETGTVTRPLLAIETSGIGGGVALLMPDGRVIERALEAPQDASSKDRPSGRGRMLVPVIAAVAREAGLGPDAIEAVAACVGPGSYTGLRIGVTAAKTLAWSLGCPVVGVSSLEALAHDAASSSGGPAGRLVPVLDARRGEVYAAFFRRIDGGVERLTDDAVLPPADLAEQLAPGDHVFGPGSRAYAELVLPEGASGSPEPRSPRASTIARLGDVKLAVAPSVPEHDLVPTYLRREGSEFRKAGLHGCR
jgi:tRNA threonylcarbamoyladenosine biosynthesis protein TsaB